MSAARSKGTYFSAKYRCIATRRGPVKAIVALEHAMLVAIWNMLTTGALYSDPGDDSYTRLNSHKAKNRALEQLKKMGYSVSLAPLTAAGWAGIFASDPGDVRWRLYWSVAVPCPMGLPW